MKRQYQIWGLAGALLWAGTVLARHFSMSFFLLGVLPNIGAVWVLMMLLTTYVPLLTHRETTRRGRFIAILAVLGLMLLSEIIHEAFLGAAFDPYDLLASLLAAVPMLVINMRSLSSHKKESPRCPAT